MKICWNCSKGDLLDRDYESDHDNCEDTRAELAKLRKLLELMQ